MSAATRTIKVTVEVTERHHAEYEIDEADYFAWLEGDADTSDALTDYLQSGDAYEVCESVRESARSGGSSQIWNTDIVEATS